MADAIGPEDWVERIRTSVERPDVAAGTVWRVRAIIPNGLGCSACEDGDGLYLHGLHARDGWPMCICGFRPIYRPKAELLESLPRKTTQPIREDA